MKRFRHQFFAFLDILKDVLAKDKISAVDQQIRISHKINLVHRTFLSHGDHGETLGGLDADEAGNLVALLEPLDFIRQMQVGQRIRIIGQEILFVGEVFFDRLQPLADVRPETGVHAGNLPIRDVAFL